MVYNMNIPLLPVPEIPKSTHGQQMTLVFILPSFIYRYMHTHMRTHTHREDLFILLYKGVPQFDIAMSYYIV